MCSCIKRNASGETQRGARLPGRSNVAVSYCTMKVYAGLLLNMTCYFYCAWFMYDDVQMFDLEYSQLVLFHVEFNLATPSTSSVYFMISEPSHSKLADLFNAGRTGRCHLCYTLTMPTPNSVTVAKQGRTKAQRCILVSNTLWWLLKDSSRLLS